MNLEYVPLLQIQRDLHAMPRGMDRFRQYLRVMLNPKGDDVHLPPLAFMNPMGKDHVTAVLDALLAVDADGVAARALADAANRLADTPGDFKAALVVIDDAGGGWTNRYAYEFALRFKAAPHDRRFWVTGPLWTSEPPTECGVREAVLAAAYRTAHVQRHGPARSLRDMLAQEGFAMAMAGCTAPGLDADDLAYSREVLVPYLDAGDMRTAVECLFGDPAARSLGFTARGLSAWAGLALALQGARLDALTCR
jgi:hypothetical protein